MITKNVEKMWRTAVKNVQNTALEKVTLSFSETSRVIVVVDFRTLLILLTKAKFAHLFHIKRLVRSYFEITRVARDILHIHSTKNVIPWDKTLGNELNSNNKLHIIHKIQGQLGPGLNIYLVCLDN
jgi:hypothetical protein